MLVEFEYDFPTWDAMTVWDLESDVGSATLKKSS